MLTEEEISHKLALAQAGYKNNPISEFGDLPTPEEHNAQPAAVLIPLLQTNSVWHLLFTRRNPDLPEHSGQVSFPGGRADPGDRSPEETALRETFEEVGIAPRDVRILGKLPCYYTVTNYLVSLIVGKIPWPYELHPAQNEVSRVFTIPFDWLADPNNREVRFRALSSSKKTVPVVYFSPYDGEILWGASAKFTLALLQALGLIE